MAAVVMSALALGALIAWSNSLALGAALAISAIALAATRTWLWLIWGSIAGLVVLAWGFNNIPLGAGGLSIPLVDAVLLYALVASMPVWLSATKTRLGRRVIGLLLFLSIVAGVRLLFDVPEYGVLAGRDALYVLEAWAVLVGFAMGRLVGEERFNRFLGVVWRVAMAWFLLYPFRDALVELGPLVGVQRPTPLLDFTNAGFIAAIALFWFLQERRRTSNVFAGAALLVLLMDQARGMFLAIAITLVVGWLAHAGTRRLTVRIGSVTTRLAAVGLIGLLVVSLLPPLNGRLGEPVGVQTVAAQLGTLLGEKGPGSGSLEHRARAWPDVVDQVFDTPAGPLIGVGYGPDLFGGFTVRGGVDVRKPHSDLLEVWARSGLIGVVPWIALLAALGWWAVRAAPTYRYGWWLIGLQIAMLMSALTQPAFAFAYRGMVYMLLTGAVWGILADRKHARDP